MNGLNDGSIAIVTQSLIFVVQIILNTIFEKLKINMSFCSL